MAFCEFPPMQDAGAIIGQSELKKVPNFCKALTRKVLRIGLCPNRNYCKPLINARFIRVA
jgi:hypothetical protein